MRPEGDDGEQAEQNWRSAEDGLIGPLALSFDTEMSTDLFERRYDILPKKLSIRSDGQVPISSSGGSYPVIRRHRDQEFARSRYSFYRGL